MEIWKVWLSGYWEYEERPRIFKRTVRAGVLCENDILELDEAEIWKGKDRPSFYGISIIP